MKKGINKETLYQTLPISLQNLVVSAEGWRLKRRRYNDRYLQIYNSAIERSKYNADQMLAYKKEKMKSFLNIADKSAYWNKQFILYGVNVNSDKTLDEITKLPILSKENVKQNTDDIIPSCYSKESLVPCHTSGTTGSGLVFYETMEAEMERWSVWWRYRNWHGIDFNTWCGYFGGRSIVSLNQKKPPYWRINSSGKQVMFSGYHLSSDCASHYVEAIKKHRLPWLHGYPSVLSLLAGFMIDQKVPPIPSVKLITIGAESLLPQQKANIQEAFGVPVYEHYGQTESVANISECEFNRLHVDEDFSLVEFVPIDEMPNTYKIVGTNWTNPAFPLIRYDTGDHVTLSDSSCPCGRSSRTVDQIDGRKEDYVYLNNGAKIGRLDHIFKDLIHIREAQIYQNSIGKVTIRVVKGDNYDKFNEEQKLIAEAKMRLGNDIAILIEYHDKIPRSRTGKLRLVVSEIS